MTNSQRRTNPARREESQERILDAAEALFAKGGFNGVSLKDISRDAEVDTSLLHYYYATKAGLFSAVLMRRAPAVNQARMASMNRYEKQAGEGISVEGVLRAYLQPTFEFIRNGGQSLRDYLTIIAQLNSTPAGQITGADVSPFDPAVQHFVALLRKAAPKRSDADLYWFYHMLSGAISLSWAQTGRIDKLSDGRCLSHDFDAIAQQMITVFAHGLDDARMPPAFGAPPTATTHPAAAGACRPGRRGG